MGAVGTRAVCRDLAHHGHDMVELERGALDTKLWKEVKRKRVRIPDLLCLRCGMRVESRAKTKPDISMSHSPNDAERAWDYGMVDTDWIAFPVCGVADEKYWSAGKLEQNRSYWHERNWVHWKHVGAINYFLVREFRSKPHLKQTMKGATEGSETSIAWPSTFAPEKGIVESIDNRRTRIKPPDAVSRLKVAHSTQTIFVSAGEAVHINQVIASTVQPLKHSLLTCPGDLPKGHIARLLASRERTQRFSGIKLARLRKDDGFCRPIKNLAVDEEEDMYVRLEGLSYLSSLCGQSATKLFADSLENPDEQIQLESVIALGETATPDAVECLCMILDDPKQAYFRRSAAAWALGRIASENATSRLVQAFSDIDMKIREEALEGLTAVGAAAMPLLLESLREKNEDVAAGCAEVLRRHQKLSEEDIAYVEKLSKDGKKWSVWLLGMLPRERVATAVADLQKTAPELHYATTLLWSFVESWISRHWELRPGAGLPGKEEAFDV